MAEHRGAVRSLVTSRWLGFKRLWLGFIKYPSPIVGDIADNGLAAVVDGDVLDLDCLNAGRTMALESVHLQHKCPCELVQHVRGTVLLRNVFDVIEAAGGDHGGIVYRCHLAREERFGFIKWTDATHNGKNSVEFFRFQIRPGSADLHELIAQSGRQFC